MGRRYTRILKFFAEHPWAILPGRLEVMIEVLELRASGHMFTDEEIQARIGAGPRRDAPSGGPVAVLPLHGVIAPRMDAMTQVSGGTSAETFGRVFRAAIADPDIAAVVLDVDSPGGNVFGVEELAAIIRDGRGRKPVVAVANTLMASAAYWVAAQAGEIVASPSSQVGSIGVIGVHQDISKAEAEAGITTTLISAGKFKLDGNEHQPLSDTARATIQQHVDSYYAAFVRDVARGRAVPEQRVRDGMGEGRILGARQALAAGLVDGIATLEQAVVRLAGGSRRVALAADAPVPRIGEPMPMLHQNEDEHAAALAPAGGDILAAATEEIADFRRRLSELAG